MQIVTEGNNEVAAVIAKEGYCWLMRYALLLEQIPLQILLGANVRN
jgi:hypothetical protein